MSIISKFSQQIYYARKAMGITQERAAEHLGISVRWYQDIENGKHLCGVELALKIVAFFGIDGKALREKEESVCISNR